MKTTVGGDRLGSGNKQEVSIRNYERSTHDLSYLWRSSMSAGTLVPFLNKVALPGDNFDIDLNAEVMTLPTIGPLFGSYKVQLDVFEVPMRLYNAKLHMNKLGVGMEMSNIFLPQIELRAAYFANDYDDNAHVNPSCLMKYLGISGLGKITTPSGGIYGLREFNAVPLLAYWDIYKNYYANKQEEIGYYIHSDEYTTIPNSGPITATLYDPDVEIGDCLGSNSQTLSTGDKLVIVFPEGTPEPDPDKFIISVDDDEAVSDVFDAVTWWPLTNTLLCLGAKVAFNTSNISVPLDDVNSLAGADVPGLEAFDLVNIDNMKESILQFNGAAQFTIDETSEAPYNCFVQHIGTPGEDNFKYSLALNQQGLGIKTYQSDLFNNWISTEWIDGENGINAITAVSTSGDEFTIDALNLAQKVYVMLNRIAISGGTYDDWLDAVYTHERVKGVESPIYHGSLIKELAFEEVISNAQTDEQPLGTLAGRGRLTQKNKGGRMNIKVNEPSIIMGIASITPRIEYSQGNDWTVNLKTYDDFHKPALDAIGFQDLITEQLLWTDTTLNGTTGAVTQKSLGKQPAWINYMTSVNKVFGNFADENKEMFMTLNRRYEKNGDGSLKDGTSYIDPTKFNQIFAETRLDAQNFWVQIAANITARRKMSAKVIPNL